MRKLLIIVALSLLVLGGCRAGKEHFTGGQQAEQTGNLQLAMEKYQAALAQEPGAPDYQTALDRVKTGLARQLAVSADAQMKVGTIEAYNEAIRLTEEALKITPQDTNLQKRKELFEQQKSKLNSEIKSVLDEAEKERKAGKWEDALNRYQQSRKQNPTNPQWDALIAETKKEGIQSLRDQAAFKIKEERFREAKAFLNRILTIDSGDEAARNTLKECSAKDTLQYFLEKGDAAYTARNFRVALAYYYRTLEYDPKNADLQQRRDLAKTGLADDLYAKAEQAIETKSWKEAVTALNEINNLWLNYKETPARLQTAKNELIKSYLKRYNTYRNQGLWGNAYIWAKKVQEVDPNYLGLQSLLDNLTGMIEKSLYVNIGILGFNSPKENPDAGSMISSMLLTYLVEHSPSELKFIEREGVKNTRPELEESEQGENTDLSKIQDIGKGSGVDLLVMGNVLKFNVENQDSVGKEVVQVKVDTKKTPNPEFENFQKRYRGRPPQDVAVPPQFLEEPVNESHSFEIKYLKRTAFINTSFRIIDVETGMLQKASTVQSKKEAKGRSSHGLKIANIPPIEQPVPPNAELLQAAAQDCSAKVAQEIIEQFNNQADKYFAQGEKSRAEAKYDRAIEDYVKCIIDVENLKSSREKYELAKQRIGEVLKQMGLD